MPYRNTPAQKAAQHRWYIKHKEQYRDLVKKQRQQKKDFINEMKNRPCMDCGQSFPPYCMDFDHKDGKDKFDDISTLIWKSGWKILRDEIQKCDVVCAVCHRKRTWNRLIKTV